MNKTQTIKSLCEVEEIPVVSSELSSSSVSTLCGPSRETYFFSKNSMNYFSKFTWVYTYYMQLNIQIPPIPPTWVIKILKAIGYLKKVVNHPIFLESIAVVGIVLTSILLLMVVQ